MRLSELHTGDPGGAASAVAAVTEDDVWPVARFTPVSRLPGVVLGDLRRGRGLAARGDHAVPLSPRARASSPSVTRSALPA